MSEEKFEQEFSVSGPAKLVVKNIRGTVDIQPGEDGKVQVKAVKHTETGDAKRTEIELSQEADGTVKAVARFPEGSIDWLFGHQPCEVDFVIQAPRQSSIKVHGVSADVHASGFEGNFSFSLVSGDVRLHDLNGPTRVQTVSGDADGEHLSGRIEVETVSGDAHLDACAFPSIKAKTVSGDVRVQTALAEGPYDFHTVSGDVSLRVPPDTHCTGELHSVSGDLASAFPVSSYSRNHGWQTIAVQGGGVMVSLRSVSGDLSLDCDGPLPAVPEPAKLVSAEERRAVLERVERGELSVDDALGQLHG